MNWNPSFTHHRDDSVSIRLNPDDVAMLMATLISTYDPDTGLTDAGKKRARVIVDSYWRNLPRGR